MKKLFFIIYSLWFLSVNGLAQVLDIIHVSDIHARLAQFEHFARYVSHKKQQARGSLVVAIGGDYDGLGPGSILDRAATVREVFAKLGVTMVVVPGNHDGSDFPPALDNYINHAHHFIGASEDPDLKLLWSNVEMNLPSHLDDSIYADYRDVALPGGQRARFVGLVLENLNKETHNMAPYIEVSSILEEMKKQFSIAHRDGIELVTFVAHDSTEKIRPIQEEFLRWKSQHYPHSSTNIGPFFSAHSHRQEILETPQDSLIINSGSYLQGATHVVFDEVPGKGIRVTEVSYDLLPETIPTHLKELSLSPSFQEAIDQANKQVAKINEVLQVPIGPTPPELRGGTRQVLRQGPHSAGTFLADLLRNAAMERMDELGIDYRPEDVVAILNTSSFRLERPLEREMMIIGDVIEMMLADYSMVFGLEGGEFQPAIEDLSQFREKIEYNPHTSSNLRYQQGNSLILDAEGNWVPVEAGRQLKVAMNDWLGGNGYGIGGTYGRVIVPQNLITSLRKPLPVSVIEQLSSASGIDCSKEIEVLVKGL